MRVHHRPLRIAIVGCGHIWRTIYRPILLSMPEFVRVEAVCDTRREAAEQAAAIRPGARVYTESGRMLEEEQIEAVLVLTSEVANAEVAALALDAGVPAYLEKPPAVSVEGWKKLGKAEAASPAKVFTAFNRRHTPLFRHWQPPSRLSRVRGVMSRRGRTAAAFPYTAVHLIDSAQYFSGRQLLEARVVLAAPEGRGWAVAGTMVGGVACDLTFVPDGDDHCEYLIFEAADQAWEMRFPNPAAGRHVDGRLRRLRPEAADECAPVPGADPLESMGFAPCFRAFLASFQPGPDRAARHRIGHCLPTIALLEATLAKIGEPASPNPALEVAAASPR